MPDGQLEESSSARDRWRSLERWQRIASIASAVVGTAIAAAGLLLALGVIKPFNASEASLAGDGGELSRFEGVAGHFEESRALLSFLDQHDREAVQLDVGFPDLATGPAGGDNVVVDSVPFNGGQLAVPRSIALMTDCGGGASPEPTPTVSDGCTGMVLTMDGPVTSDSGGHFEHGVPVIDGYFLVDVTGGLHMGVSPIFLKPLTFDQATGG